LPPVEGKPYPHFVPAVDRDGNEVTSIRLPNLTVPLATYTGWNLRHRQMGAPDRLMSLMGSTIPFPATQEDRARTSDPRRSITERYPSRASAKIPNYRYVVGGYAIRARCGRQWAGIAGGSDGCCATHDYAFD
jgi:hypothetical protein